MLNVHVVIHCRFGDQASSLTLSYNVNFSCTALELQSTLLPFNNNNNNNNNTLI